MTRKIFPIFPALFLFLALGACAGSQRAWTPLAPMGHRTPSESQKAEKTLKGVAVSSELSEGKYRYMARIEVRNDGRETIHGPQDIVLKDGDGTVQETLSLEQMKEEIWERAELEASYTRSAWPPYYYLPRRVYYEKNRYRTVYVGPYYYRYGHYDWVERQIEGDRILERARTRIDSLDTEYMKSQDIPPGGTLTGFVEFSKTGTGGPFSLSLTVSRRIFLFEFAQNKN